MPLGEFLRDPENTRNPYASASIAAFLDTLAKKYLADCPTAEAEHAKLQHYIDDFCLYVGEHFHGDNQLLRAISAARTVVTEAFDHQSEVVNCFKDGKTHEFSFPIFKVFGLVSAAVFDEAAYDPANKNPLDRINSICNALKKLHKDQLCHISYRHELVGCLNHVYPGAAFIEEIDSFFYDTAAAEITVAMRREDPAKQWRLFLAWLKLQRLPGSSIDQHPELKAFFTDATLKQTISQRLREQCAAHYINPDAQDEHHAPVIMNRISATLANLEFLPLTSVFAEKTALQVVEIYRQSGVKHQSKQKERALERAKKAVDGCKSFNEVDQLPNWQLFNQALSTQRKIAESYMLFICNGVGANQEVIFNMQQIIDNFYARYSTTTQKLPAIPYFDVFEIQFAVHYHDILHDSDAKFICNFFQLLQATNDNNLRMQCFAKVKHHIMRKKIVLDSSMVESIFAKAQSGELQLTPYEINRVLLHATLVSPKHWEAGFHSLFKLTLQYLVSNRPGLDANFCGAIKRHIPHFEFLNYLYFCHHSTAIAPEFNIETLSNVRFYMPQNFSGVVLANVDDRFHFGLNLLHAQNLAQYVQSVQGALVGFPLVLRISDVSDFLTFIQKIIKNNDERNFFIKSLIKTIFALAHIPCTEEQLNNSAMINSDVIAIFLYLYVSKIFSQTNSVLIFNTQTKLPIVAKTLYFLAINGVLNQTNFNDVMNNLTDSVALTLAYLNTGKIPLTQARLTGILTNSAQIKDIALILLNLLFCKILSVDNFDKIMAHAEYIAEIAQNFVKMAKKSQKTFDELIREIHDKQISITSGQHSCRFYSRAAAAGSALPLPGKMKATPHQH
jgi:hypothetical protein